VALSFAEPGAEDHFGQFLDTVRGIFAARCWRCWVVDEYGAWLILWVNFALYKVVLVENARHSHKYPKYFIMVKPTVT